MNAARKLDPKRASHLTLDALAAVDVLIVDDNAHMRTLIKTILRAAGLERLREAQSAEMAWSELRRRASDVILLDFAMQEMSGIDLMRRLRADPDSPAPQARVIMVSGYCDVPRMAAARDAGADEFLAKPLTAKALLDRIASVVQRGRDLVTR